MWQKVQPYVITVACVVLGVVIANAISKTRQIDPATGKPKADGEIFKTGVALGKQK